MQSNPKNMIYCTIVEQPEYLLLNAIASRGKLTAIDLHKINIRQIATEPYSETLQPKLGEAVAGKKGLVINDTTKASWITGHIVSECRNRVPWMAGYYKGVAIVFNTTTPDKAVGESVAAPLICLKCLEAGTETVLRSDAIYPYCVKHQDNSPHRW